MDRLDFGETRDCGAAGDTRELPSVRRAAGPGQRQRTVYALPGRRARPVERAAGGAGELLGARAGAAGAAERHLGRVIRAYRCHPYHGRVALPQTVVAGWLGITQAQLSRVENGPPLVHLDRLAHWARSSGYPLPASGSPFPTPALPTMIAPTAPACRGRDCHDHANR